MYPNYPPQQPGYPGYPQQSQPGYPGAADPNQAYGGGFMPQPGGIGFDAPPYGGGSSGFPMGGGGGYPPQQGGYPPQQGGYPPQQQPGGYPQPGIGGGYPPQQPSGYPQAPQGYPQAGGYPGQAPPPHQGYPQGTPSYPGGYSGQQYPQGAGAYPGAQPPGAGYPQQQPGSAANNFLPAHIASNPNFQPTQPAGGNIYPNIGGGSGPGNYGAPTPSRPFVGTPSLRPFQPFNPNDDAAKLYKAMKGFGTDETVLIDILCRRTSQQRQEIARAYKSSIGKDLLKNLVDELRGNFELVFKAMMYLPAALEAHDLKDAIDGLGTKESTVIDIICTKTSNADMMNLKTAYRQMYGRDLENELRGDVSGYFQRFLVSLLTANRAENVAPDYARAQQQAKELYAAGEKQMGTNEVTFNRIFATESMAQLKLIFEEYYKLTGHDIDKAIKKEMSGDVERAFLAVAQVARNPPAYFAQRLHETMYGGGTHDRALIRNIVLRSEIDMMDVKTEFQRKYGKTLESFIKSDCSGDYKRALLCLVGDLNWR